MKSPDSIRSTDRGLLRFALGPDDLLRDRTYRRLWASTLISSFGAQVTLLAVPLTAAVLLQQAPRSQHGSVTQRVGITDISISYNRPVARGRDLFGGAKYTLSTEKQILPQTIRRIPVTWDKAPTLGLFKIGGTATVLGKSQTLPTKYVLVMSQTIRIVCLVIVCVVILLLVSRYVLRRQAKRPKVSKR